jgi:predicted dehydrogenase
LHRLEYYDYDKEDAKTRGWRSIHVSDNGGEHPYMDKWWVPGLNIGYEHSFINQFADFVDGFGSRKKRPNRPDFRDALETQYICEAVLDSAKSGRWKKVGKIKAK